MTDRHRLPQPAAGPCRGLTALAAAALLAMATPGQELDGGSTDGVFSVPRSQDTIAAWLDARGELRDGRPQAAAERLIALWQSDPRGVVPVPGALNRWQGARQAIRASLRDLPDSGREVVEDRARRQLGADASTPLDELSDADLLHIARTWPTAAIGLAARLRLGDLALVAGDGITAQQHYRAARDALPADRLAAADIVERTRVAGLLVEHAERDVDATDALSRSVLAVLGDAPGHPWAAYGGGYDGKRPMTAPAGNALRSFTWPIEAIGFELNPFAMQPVGDLRGIYVNDGHAVHALDPVAGDIAWRFTGPILGTDHLYEARGAVNADLTLSCAVGDDTVVAALQVPHDVTGADRSQQFRTISIIEKIPARRLFAFDRRTGKLRWTHWDFEGGPVAERFRGHDACGAPLVHGDLVLCATHDQTGAIAFYVTAYDLHTGALRWRRLVCSSQQEVNMFGNAQQEFAAGPLAVRDGVVYGTTNLGVCFAADLEDGGLRWLSEYETIPLPPTQLRNQERRRVYFANNPIVVLDGVMATTPLDSASVLGIDCETGRQLWSVRYDEPRGTQIRWLLGALDGRFVLSGLGIAAVAPQPDPDTGRPRCEVIANFEELGERFSRSNDIPRGALTADRIWYVASKGGIRILDAQGRRDPRMADLAIGGVGNLLLIDGIAVLTGARSVQIHVDLEGLIYASRTELRRHPDDPALLLRIAQLEHAVAADGLLGVRGERVIEAYRSALAAASARGLGPGAALYDRIAAGLFQVSFDRAREVAKADPRTGLRLLRAARDAATSDEDWLRAQAELLDRVRDDRRTELAELRLLAERHDATPWTFDRVGRVPAGVYAQWRMLDLLDDAAEAVELAQRLAERYGDVRLGGRPVRDLCNARISDLIEQRGRGCYARVEARAAQQLAAAGDDSEALQAVVEQFPHSNAAATATARLLDVAVERGDLHTAGEAFARANAGGEAPPGVLRRLAAAAERGGNPALAAALGARLRDRHGAQISDFAGDGGRRFAELFAGAAPLPPRTPPPVELPVTTLARLEPPNMQSMLSVVPVRVATGFASAGPVPLIVAVDDTELVALDLDPLPSGLGSRRFSVPVQTQPTQPRGDLQLCGSVLVVVEPDRVRGLRISDGAELWRTDAADGRRLTSLGVVHGVLQIYSSLAATAGDGGYLLGVEPIGGARLYTNVFPDQRDAVQPLVADGALWTIDTLVPDAAAVVEYDALTGAVVGRTPLRAETLRFLGIGGDYAHRIHDPQLHTEFVVDAERVYLPMDKLQAAEPARIAAVRRGGGEIAWRWTGDPSLELFGLARAPQALVVAQRGRTAARVEVLDARSGQVLRSVDLTERFTACNWPDTMRGGSLDDALLLTDRPGAWRLTCLGLAEGRPSFQQSFPNVLRVLDDPLLGPDFVAIPVRRQVQPQPTVYVYRASSRVEGALPDGADQLTLDDQSPFSLTTHQGHVIAVALNGIRILGRPR
ncbi:MAG: PQQ-like beta-propeller repeat protein [Planctomycetes bacterium]|nr:PQQ-like beta-propeller repeat protein [Planctomycetota bacterium]